MPKHQRPLTLICIQFICKIFIFLYFYERRILNCGKYPCLLDSEYNSIKKARKIDILILRAVLLGRSFTLESILVSRAHSTRTRTAPIRECPARLTDHYGTLLLIIVSIGSVESVYTHCTKVF